MSLIELMVAMSILALIVIVFGQALGAITGAWTLASEKMDNFSKARSMLSRMQVDLQNFAAREDLPNFGENGDGSVLGFYTLQRGISFNGGNDRALSYVHYEFEEADPVEKGPTLRRYNQPHSYEGNGSAAFLPAPTPSTEESLGFPSPTPLNAGSLPHVVALRGLLGFSLSFMHKNGEYSPSYYHDSNDAPGLATAVTVSMVIADDKTIGVLKDRGGGLLEQLISELRLTQTNAKLVTAKSIWDYQLGLTNARSAGASSRLDFQRYGTALIDGVRTFERTFPLPPPQ